VVPTRNALAADLPVAVASAADLPVAVASAADPPVAEAVASPVVPAGAHRRVPHRLEDVGGCRVGGLRNGGRGDAGAISKSLSRRK
jgi:hypothetical protein